MTTPQTPVDALTDDECDALVARVMDEVAKAKGLEHAMHLNADITTQHTLRRAIVRASARALAAVPAPSELQESVRWKQLVHMVERGVTPEILVDWINHPNRLDYAAKLRAEHG